MKVFGRVRNFLGAVLILAGVVVGTAVPVQAADGEIPEYRIQVSPARFDMDLAPGKSLVEKFKVQNTGSKSFKYELEVAPYSVSDEQYNSDFSSESKYTDIVNWISLSQESGTLEAGGSDEITATIVVPKDVPAGGQYAAVLARIADDSENGGTGVDIVRQVGIIFYSNVDGVTRKEAEVTENKISNFLFKPPINATSIVENTGNVHVEASYVLQVFPFFGGEEVYTNEENPEKHVILPETRRFNTMTWDGSPQLGLFKVRQTVTVLGKSSTVEKVVFLCPIWFLFIIVLIIFCVIFWIVSRVRNRNKE